jgi:hypothetical protein
MKKRIYLDDVRTPIEKDNWVIVRSYDEFVEKINEIGLENIDMISLDHDLGDTAMAEWHKNVYKNYELITFLLVGHILFFILLYAKYLINIQIKKNIYQSKQKFIKKKTYIHIYC